MQQATRPRLDLLEARCPWPPRVESPRGRLRPGRCRCGPNPGRPADLRGPAPRWLLADRSTSCRVSRAGQVVRSGQDRSRHKDVIRLGDETRRNHGRLARVTGGTAPGWTPIRNWIRIRRCRNRLDLNPSRKRERRRIPWRIIGTERPWSGAQAVQRRSLGLFHEGRGRGKGRRGRAWNPLGAGVHGCARRGSAWCAVQVSSHRRGSTFATPARPEQPVSLGRELWTCELCEQMGRRLPHALDPVRRRAATGPIGAVQDPVA